ncbi:MAG: cytochrome family protein [Phycisphaerales bacterium]|nr:cytochrome family protein [Phycisphaerales bacterium]
MPKIAQTLGDVNVCSHTFHFVTPAKTESLKIPNACNVCHTDKTPAWATQAKGVGRAIAVAQDGMSSSPLSAFRTSLGTGAKIIPAADTSIS